MLTLISCQVDNIDVDILQYSFVIFHRCAANHSVLFFSPSGKLVQIEYALQAVAAGAPSVGIKGMSSTT